MQLKTAASFYFHIESVSFSVFRVSTRTVHFSPKHMVLVDYLVMYV